MKRNNKEQVNTINQQIKELIGVYRGAGKRMKLSETEFWVWYTLVAMNGEYTQQDICAMWSLPKQTVNTVITHMRLKKYARLEAVPGTRNHKIVRLTEEGRKHGESIVFPVTSAEEKAFEKISADELSAAIQTLGKYVGILRGEVNAAAT